MSRVFCTRCGQQNDAEARFCSQCGAPLARPGERAPVDPGGPLEQTSTVALETPAGDATGIGDDARSAAAALPAGSALLVVTHGPNAGSRFLLDQDVTTAGRHPDSDIFLDDVTVSRRHAEVVRTSTGGFRVRDVGSLNGTYVNRERIDEGELAAGDEVQIGKFRLIYLAAGETPGGSS